MESKYQKKCICFQGGKNRLFTRLGKIADRSNKANIRVIYIIQNSSSPAAATITAIEFQQRVISFIEETVLQQSSKTIIYVANHIAKVTFTTRIKPLTLLSSLCDSPHGKHMGLFVSSQNRAIKASICADYSALNNAFYAYGDAQSEKILISTIEYHKQTVQSELSSLRISYKRISVAVAVVDSQCCKACCCPKQGNSEEEEVSKIHRVQYDLIQYLKSQNAFCPGFTEECIQEALQQADYSTPARQENQDIQ